jgi:hypothetical protein
MSELRMPMGLGMEPSLRDISLGLGVTMTLTLVLMAAIGLVIPAAAPNDHRVYRVSAWTVCLANLAMLAIWWYYQVPPPLVFQVALTPILALAALLPRPAQA